MLITSERRVIHHLFVDTLDRCCRFALCIFEWYFLGVCTKIKEVKYWKFRRNYLDYLGQGLVYYWGAHVKEAQANGIDYQAPHYCKTTFKRRSGFLGVLHPRAYPIKKLVHCHAFQQLRILTPSFGLLENAEKQLFNIFLGSDNTTPCHTALWLAFGSVSTTQRQNGHINDGVELCAGWTKKITQFSGRKTK